MRTMLTLLSVPFGDNFQSSVFHGRLHHAAIASGDQFGKASLARFFRCASGAFQNGKWGQFETLNRLALDVDVATSQGAIIASPSLGHDTEKSLCLRLGHSAVLPIDWRTVVGCNVYRDPI